MDKNEKVILLLPYKLKSNLEIDEILKFLQKRKRRMLGFLIATIVFAICVLTMLILSQFEKNSGYLLMLSAVLNVGVFYINFRQVNLTDEEIKAAVDLYREKKFGKSA